MRSFFVMAALALCATVASAQQTLFFMGTNETDRSVRFQHVYDIRSDWFRLAGLNNFDNNRYQLKPRFSVDLATKDKDAIALVWQKEIFESSFQVTTRRGVVERTVFQNTDRFGISLRNEWKTVRNEFIVYGYDSDTHGQRVEDILTVRLPYNFAVNNQYWNDFTTNVQFNQFSVLYSVKKNAGFVAQYNTITNRDPVTRVGVWVRF